MKKQKDIMESADVMAAYASIDMCYLALEKIYKQMAEEENSDTRSPIERMVDQATGYREDHHETRKQSIIDLLKEVIENKKFINADYTGARITLNLIEKL
jgi:N-methylhydantoinase B/oxoprolinase/acetone carboxylase alpha subunit